MKEIRFQILLLITLFIMGCDNTLQLAFRDILQVQPPETNFEPGVYPGPIEISLYCETQGAQIYYTLDKTEPNRNSLVYRSPIPLETHDQSVVIRAMAYKEELGTSQEFMATFKLVCQGPEEPLLAGITDSGQWLDPLQGGTYQEDIYPLIMRAPGSFSYYEEEEVRFCYTLDGTIPRVDTFNHTPMGSTILVGPEEINPEGYYVLPHLVSGAESATIMARAYVLNREMGLPPSGWVSQNYRVQYMDRLSLIPELAEPKGTYETSLEPTPVIHQEVLSQGGMLQYKISGLLGGIPYPAEDDQVSPAQFVEWDNPLLFPQDSALNGDTITLTLRYYAQDKLPSPEISYTYTYYVGMPHAPRIEAAWSEEPFQGIPNGEVLFSEINQPISSGERVSRDISIEISASPMANLYVSTTGSVPNENHLVAGSTQVLTPTQEDLDRGFLTVTAQAQSKGDPELKSGISSFMVYLQDDALQIGNFRCLQGDRPMRRLVEWAWDGDPQLETYYMSLDGAPWVDLGDVSQWSKEFLGEILSQNSTISIIGRTSYNKFSSPVNHNFYLGVPDAPNIQEDPFPGMTQRDWSFCWTSQGALYYDCNLSLDTGNFGDPVITQSNSQLTEPNVRYYGPDHYNQMALSVICYNEFGRSSDLHFEQRFF